MIMRNTVYFTNHGPKHLGECVVWVPEGMKSESAEAFGMRPMASSISTEDFWVSWPEHDDRVRQRFRKRISLVRFDQNGHPEGIVGGYAGGAPITDLNRQMREYLIEFYRQKRPDR